MNYNHHSHIFHLCNKIFQHLCPKFDPQMTVSVWNFRVKCCSKGLTLTNDDTNDGCNKIIRSHNQLQSQQPHSCTLEPVFPPFFSKFDPQMAASGWNFSGKCCSKGLTLTNDDTNEGCNKMIGSHNQFLSPQPHFCTLEPEFSPFFSKIWPSDGC